MQKITVPLDQILPFIRHAEYTGSPIMLTGPSGIGKTQFVETIAKESGRLCCTKIFAAMGTEDIALAGPKAGGNFIQFLVNEGFPFVGTEEKWLHPQTKNAPILFADELNNTLPYLQNAILQLFGERSIHGIPLIPGTVIIGAGNRAEDAAHTSKISGPLANRLIHINVEPPTVDGFKDFCIKNGVNEFIPAYIDQAPQHLHVFNPDNFAVEKAFPTPRAWVRFVGPVIDNKSLSDNDRLALIGGSVGFGVAHDFETFYRLRNELPDMDTILQTGKGPVPKNVSTRLLVVAALVRRADAKNLRNIFSYVGSLTSKDPEWGDLFEKNLFIKAPAFAGHPAYTQWVITHNRKPITNAQALAAAGSELPEEPKVEEPKEQQQEEPKAEPSKGFFGIPGFGGASSPTAPAQPSIFKKRI